MFKIYTRENCIFCTKAKMLLNAAGFSYEETRAGEDIISKSEMRSVPIIYYGETLIGGYNELDEYVRNLL